MVEAPPISSAEATLPQQSSKKQKDRDCKKLKNKTKQAITVLCKAEARPFESLFSQEPTTQMFVAHFGNGDEADQELVLSFVRDKAGAEAVKEITILPGINYGHLVFQHED